MSAELSPELEVVLPVHNEGQSIAATVGEIYDEISPVARLSFIFCEDGSADNTKQVLTGLAEELPARLLLSDERKGYSRAVRDGMMAQQAQYLLCLDSDGQCDPKDFQKFWAIRESADILIGWRVHRADNRMRKLMSRSFYMVWRTLFHCPIHDPSCPFVMARREVIQQLWPHMGAMKQGFWWEFTARAKRMGFSIRELPVEHRDRSAGVTQVYRLKKLPGIGYRHGVALFRIFYETRRARTTRSVAVANTTVE